MFKYSLIILVLASLQAFTSGQNLDRKFKCPQPNGLFPRSNQPCSKHFYICSAGVPFIRKCPAPSVFVPQEAQCKIVLACLIGPSTVEPEESTGYTTGEELSTYPVEEDDESSTTEEEGSTMQEQEATSTEITGGPTDIITEEESSTYSEAIEQEVQTTTEEQASDSQEEGDSSTAMEQSSTPQETSSAPTTKPTSVVCPPTGGSQLANPNDCQSFYMCSNGVLYSFACPAGLVYNDAQGICDWPYNVKGC